MGSAPQQYLSGIRSGRSQSGAQEMTSKDVTRVLVGTRFRRFRGACRFGDLVVVRSADQWSNGEIRMGWVDDLVDKDSQGGIYNLKHWVELDGRHLIIGLYLYITNTYRIVQGINPKIAALPSNEQTHHCKRKDHHMSHSPQSTTSSLLISPRSPTLESFGMSPAHQAQSAVSQPNSSYPFISSS